MQGYKSFREYVDYREATAPIPMPGAQPDQATDDEIVKNPNLLKLPPKPGQDPRKQQDVIRQAVTSKQQNKNVSLDAALKAASMANKRL